MNLDNIGKTIGDIFGWNKKKPEVKPVVNTAPLTVARQPINMVNPSFGIKSPQPVLNQPTLTMGQAPKVNIIAPKPKVYTDDFTKLASVKTRQKTLKQNVDKGLSMDQISKNTGLTKEEIGQFTNEYRPGYGAKDPFTAVRDWAGDMAKSTADIVIKPTATINAVANKDVRQGIESLVNTADKAYRAGQISKAMLEQKVKEYSGDIIGAAYKVTDNGVESMNEGEKFVKFAGGFVDTGVNASNLIPTGLAFNQGKKILLEQGFKVVAKQIAMLNAKQALVQGTAQTAADLLNNRGVSVESIAMNYAAPFVLGTAGELAGIGINNIKFTKAITGAIDNAENIKGSKLSTPELKTITAEVKNELIKQIDTPTPQVSKTDPNRNWKLSNQVDAGNKQFTDAQHAVSKKMDEFRAKNNGKPFTPAQKKELNVFIDEMDKGLNLTKKASAELSTPVAQVSKTVDPDVISDNVTTSIKNNPVDIKPNRLDGKGYSLEEARTGKMVSGVDKDARIVIGKNDNGAIVMKDGTHLLEGYRQQGIDIPSRKVKLVDGVKMSDINKPNVRLKSTDNLPAPLYQAKQGIWQSFRHTMTDEDTVILDELRGIEKKTGQTGLVDRFMYDSNLQRGANATANVHIQRSPNLQKAIGGMSGDTYKSFSDYANARAELSFALSQKTKAGKQMKVSTSRSIPELQRIVERGDATFDGNFTALNQHYKELASMARENGLIDDATFRKYVANDNYVHIQRDMGDLVSQGRNGVGNGYQIGSTRLSRKTVGSTKQIMGAGETAADFTQQIYKEMAKNKTGTDLVDNLYRAGLANKLKNSADATNKNVVKIMRNGKTEFFEVSPEIKTAMDNINPYTMNVVMKVLATPGRVLRAGVTGMNQVFIIRNLVKDQQSAAIHSGHAISNMKSFFPGLFNATTDAMGMNNNPIYVDFLKHYGDITSYDLTRNAKNASAVVGRIRGGKKVGFKQAVLSPIRTLENVASITEKSTRFQSFRGEFQRAIAEGLPKDVASERAAMAAWQNSVDFGRAGTWGRVINTVIPYWNPATQGVRQMGRSITQHPIKTALTATAVIGVPLAGATAWNLSNPDTAAVYNNIPEYEKENNLILIPPGTVQNEDGSYDVIKVPLAPGWKDAYMPVRRAMEAFYQDKPADFAKMVTDILQTIAGPVNFQSPGAFVGSFTPQAIKPVVQQAMNQDLFSGNQIVPDYMQQATDAEGNPVAENKKAYKTTSGTAGQIGDLFGVSPIRVEKAVKDVGGAVGLQILNAVDTAQAGMGTIDKNRIGGQSVEEGLYKSFSKTQGIDNANATPGALYYKNLTKAQEGLNTNEKAAFTSLHPSSKNFLGDVITETDSIYNSAARLDVYNRYPKVFEADKALDKKNREANGYGNPLFDLTPEQVKKVLEKENLPPGAKDPELSTLYDKEWYTTYSADKSTYFDNIQKSQQKDLEKAQSEGNTERVKSLTASIDKFNSPKNPYPQTSPELQSAMDQYSALPSGTGAKSNWIRSNPGAWAAMQQQWAAIDNWQNIQRGLRGLDATEGAAGIANGYGTANSYGSGGSGKSSYRVAFSGGGNISKGPSVPKSSVALKSVSQGAIKKPTVKLTKSKV